MKVHKFDAGKEKNYSFPSVFTCSTKIDKASTCELSTRTLRRCQSTRPRTPRARSRISCATSCRCAPVPSRCGGRRGGGRRSSDARGARSSTTRRWQCTEGRGGWIAGWVSGWVRVMERWVDGKCVRIFDDWDRAQSTSVNKEKRELILGRLLKKVKSRVIYIATNPRKPENSSKNNPA